jgi:hypothetical protein
MPAGATHCCPVVGGVAAIAADAAIACNDAAITADTAGVAYTTIGRRSVGTGAAVAAVSEQPGVAAVARPLRRGGIAALAAVPEEQAAPSAVLAQPAVGAVADQQPAVLARLVTVADEDADEVAERITTDRAQGSTTNGRS